MLRCLSLCLLLLCRAGSSFGQDYSRYHEGILHAEEAMASGDFRSAVKIYDAAFNGYPRVFARDAYHACQLAALEDPAYFKRFYILCAQSGVPKALLLKNELIRGQLVNDTPQYNRLYSEGRKDFRQRIDTHIRQEFISRYQLEQKNKSGTEYREICSDNFNRILVLAQQGRYPGEDLIGPDDELSSYYVLATLLHYPYSYVLLRDYLMKGLRQGKVQPGMVLYLYGFNQTRTSVLYTPMVPVDTQHFSICYNTAFGRQSKDTAAVNRARAAFYYPSLQVQQNLRAMVRRHALDYRE